MNVSASMESHRNISTPLARRTHRFSAILIGTFGVLHLCNHPVVAAGAEAHQALMDLLRHLYRTPVAELALYVAIGAQVVSGWTLFRQTRGARGERRWRRYSGAFLSFFLVAHGLAAQYQRHVVGLDSNAYWAAAVLVWPWALWFVPYYMLGVTSFTVHLGPVFGVRAARSALLGGGLAAVIILGLSGAFHPMLIPAPYQH
jgi:hypothetical protein